MPKPLPTIGYLRRLLSYDPVTGILTWLARAPKMFAGATEKNRSKSTANLRLAPGAAPRCANGR